MPKKKTLCHRPIVTGHLEKISSSIFDKYHEQIMDMMRGNCGVYALYRKDTLYYVGLATDFKTRINQHLSDRHAGKWNKFSLYLIRRIDHIPEIERLLLRISKPRGNKNKGKLHGSKNLSRELEHRINEENIRQKNEIFGQKTKSKSKKAPDQSRHSTKKQSQTHRPLAGVFPTGKVLYATFKGVPYKAWVGSNGRIKVSGKRYDSPSPAAKAITHKSVDGWFFWKYKDASKELCDLDSLRK